MSRTGTARAVLGAVPEGPLRLWRMRQAYERLYRSDLFESAWPRITVTGDSTLGRIEVRKRPAQELQLAAGYDNDIDMRTHAALILRRKSGPLPAYATAQGTLDRLGWRAMGSLEGTSLRRGLTGWFLRGGAGEKDTRVYEGPALERRVRTSRQEAMLGGQLLLPWGATVQAGAGYGRARESAGAREGVIAAVRTEGNGVSRRRLDIVTMGGRSPYSAAAASVDVQIGLGPLQVVPGVRAGAASGNTPLDELPALGGPRSFAGLHHGEWRGRRMLGLELCVLRHLQGDLLCHVAVQAGRIEEPVSRRDHGERFRSAGEVGVELSTPFGPLRADFGFPEAAPARFDVSLGLGF